MRLLSYEWHTSVHFIENEISKVVFIFVECICENGLVRHNDRCIEASKCPCERDGKEYAVGESVTEGCRIL